jgi:hypothetical protein
MGLQDNHKKTPQVHVVPASLWEKGCGACRIHQSEFVHRTITHMSKEESVGQRLMDLEELEETRILADFHQSVEKPRKKAWHVNHIKTKLFAQGDKVLLYDSRYQKYLGKLCMHWLGPFIIAEI